MVENILINKLMYDLLEISNTSFKEEDLIANFKSLIIDIFGVDRVEVTQLYNHMMPKSTLYSYLSNTRKPYVDNAISEFSEFSELIKVKNNGYKSCLLFPIISNGKMVATLNLFSLIENKFDNSIIEVISLASNFIGLSLINRINLDINIKLAAYFDSAFNSTIPQALVSSNNSIIKSNAAFNKIFPTLIRSNTSIENIIGKSYSELFNTINKPQLLAVNVENRRLICAVSSSKVSDSLIHVVINDITYSEIQKDISKIIEKYGNFYIITMDNKFRITDIQGNTDSQTINSSALNRKLTEFIRPEDKEDLIKDLDIKVGSVGNGELDVLDESSNPVPMKFYALRTEYGYTVFIESTTLQNRMNELEDNFTDLISNTSDIVLIIDNLGYIKDCNIQVEQFLGYKKEELIGKEINDIYIEKETLDRDISYARKGTKINGTYINLKKKNGEILPAVHFLRTKRDSESPSFIILINELERKRKINDLESEMRKYVTETRKLKNETDLKSDFIYNISHELKTPLTNIMGFSKFIIDGEFGDLNSEQKENLNIILDESNRLMGIITQTLDATKLDAEKVRLDMHEVNIKDMINNPSIKALQESAAAKGLSFKWESSYDVPNIMADPNKLIQVFVNLIGNSIKFTEQGGITVRIFPKTSRTIQCEVIDTGDGISEEDKRRLFKKFYQSQRKELARKNGEGTGLGLSITHSIIKLHHGKIRIESELGKGTKFIFTLPINYKPRRKRNN